MGQKVNPNGFRVGVIKDWNTRWYASKKDFSDYLVEDKKIRDHLKKVHYAAGVAKIDIERAANKVTVSIHTARPGMLIGKGGVGVDAIKADVSALIGKPVNVNIMEVRNPDANAQLVAENIAQQLEKRISFRRAMKQAMQRPYYHISLTNDVIGLESAVAIKNAYAMAVTLAVGLNIRWHGEEEPQHYNSQAGTFTQAVRETHALMLMQGGEFESECIGLGDLYVTIFSGRTRRCGVLMGKGLNYDQVTEALAGITLESLVITRIMGNAIRRKAELGLVDLRDFPLLMHIVDILDHGKSDSDIPWEAFTFEHLK